MNINDKTLARTFFQNKIHEANGQSFQDIFVKIMNYKDRDFQSIKPYGNIGDRKNDGYIKAKGIYYQVYAPEDGGKNYSNVIKKLNTDFVGLQNQWGDTTPIQEFYFVLNDKFKGVNADCELELERVKKNNNLRKSSFITPKDLMNWLFELSDDQIIDIVGFIPDPQNINLDYGVLTQVISYVMQLEFPINQNNEIELPNWNNKIQFNGLSESTKQLLNGAYFSVSSLEKYLRNDANFLEEELKNKIQGIYIEEKLTGKKGDDLFILIAKKLAPRNQKMFLDAALVIMAKYFESCDIFEKPNS
jgi:hypothetical protein